MTHPWWSVWSLHLWLSKLTSPLGPSCDYPKLPSWCRRVDVQRSLKLFVNKAESLASPPVLVTIPIPSLLCFSKPHHHPLKNLQVLKLLLSLSHHLISWPACPVASTFKTSHVCSFLFTFSSISQVKATVIFIWATQWSSDSNLIGLFCFLKILTGFQHGAFHINCFSLPGTLLLTLARLAFFYHPMNVSST